LQKKLTCKIDFLDVPDAPQNLKVESFGSDFVELSWSPPEIGGGSSLLHYRIEMKEAKRRVFQRAGQVPANTTKFRVEGLDIDRLYLFRVAGINKFGTGEFCAPVEQTTNVPFEAPQIHEPPTIVSINDKVNNLCLTLNLLLFSYASLNGRRALKLVDLPSTRMMFTCAKVTMAIG
jgi:titin